MPFVTEELWQKLPKHADLESPESIMVCSYPAVDLAWSSAEVEADMDAVTSLVAKTRSLRSGLLCGAWRHVLLPKAQALVTPWCAGCVSSADGDCKATLAAPSVACRTP